MKFIKSLIETSKRVLPKDGGLWTIQEYWQRHQ